MKNRLVHLRLSRSGARPLGPAPASRGQRQTKRGRGPLAGILAGGLLFTIALGVAPDARAVDEAAPNASPNQVRHPRENTYIKRRWGIEVMDVQQTAAGYMLEFRYRVLDAEKAKPLFERRTKPVLIHTETGAKLVVPAPPTTGSLRNSNPPLAGHTYWMFFENPGKVVQPGQHVSIEIGEFRVDGLVVR